MHPVILSLDSKMRCRFKEKNECPWIRIKLFKTRTNWECSFLCLLRALVDQLLLHIWHLRNHNDAVPGCLLNLSTVIQRQPSSDLLHPSNIALIKISSNLRKLISVHVSARILHILWLVFCRHSCSSSKYNLCFISDPLFYYGAPVLRLLTCSSKVIFLFCFFSVWTPFFWRCLFRMLTV